VFHTYHLASRWINSVGMVLTLVAASVAAWPVRRSQAVLNP